MATEAVVPDVKVVEKNALSLVETANAFKVVDQASLETATELLKTIKKMRVDEVNATFDPIISAAHKAHKAANDAKKKIDDPLSKADIYLRGQVSTYTNEQERQRRIAQESAQKAANEAAQAEAKKRQEEQQIAAAIAAETAGDTDRADAIINTVQEAPVVAPPPVLVQSTVQEVKGLGMRDNWRFEVTDFMALVKAVADGKVLPIALEVNEKWVGSKARNDKSMCNLPGVRVWNDPTPVVRG